MTPMTCPEGMQAEIDTLRNRVEQLARGLMDAGYRISVLEDGTERRLAQLELLVHRLLNPGEDESCTS